MKIKRKERKLRMNKNEVLQLSSLFTILTVCGGYWLYYYKVSGMKSDSNGKHSTRHTNEDKCDPEMINLELLTHEELVQLVRKKEKQRQEARKSRSHLENELREISRNALDTSRGLYVQPIAKTISCFKECVGTPRQGLLVPSGLAKLRFDTISISPCALENLKEFSHVWITFVFHLNTNQHIARYHSNMISSSAEIKSNSKTLSEDRNANDIRSLDRTLTNEEENKNQPSFEKRRGITSYTFPAKITPPMLKKKVGILSTRTPHRPNPIGITLARLESIDELKREIIISSHDLVDGTPILDVKPYVPYYDSVPLQESTDTVNEMKADVTKERKEEIYTTESDNNKDIKAKSNKCFVPSWISENISNERNIFLTQEAYGQVVNLSPHFDLFRNNEKRFLDALKETLSVDIRSKHKGEIYDGETTHFRKFDNMIIHYQCRNKKVVHKVHEKDAHPKETIINKNSSKDEEKSSNLITLQSHESNFEEIIIVSVEEVSI